MQKQELRDITEVFSTIGEFIDAIPFGSGHINDTYLITTSSEKYILQKINHNIFINIEMMNQNIIKALKHLNSKQKLNNDTRFKKLDIILSKDGANHYKDTNANYWRMMNFVSDSISFDVADKPEIAYEAAKAYGYFQKNLIDLDTKDFFPVIKDFHNLEMRINSFQDVVETNTLNRNQFAINEIEFVKAHIHISIRLNDLLKNKIIPLRITHNDTKINNVLIDKNSLKGIAVIDLDTIMPGTVLFDFGDMVRTFTSPAEEDETDLSKVDLRLDIFKALAEGYLSELRDVITDSELNNLVFGGKVMTFMIGLRFLTDFLQGDIYFKTSRKNHNLDRCRTQFKLLKEIKNKEVKLNQIINNLLG